eukprot:m.6193 g.6193  ORF g.6193 m.6193 type:complete len:233 (-) comp3495_c0_seq2:1929-2627(-)
MPNDWRCTLVLLLLARPFDAVSTTTTTTSTGKPHHHDNIVDFVNLHGCPLILDTRTSKDCSRSKVKCAICTPEPSFKESGSIQVYVKTRAKKDFPIITYCYVGNWAGIVKDELLQDGFTSVWNGGGYTFVRDRLLLEDICTACEEVYNSTTTISSTSTTSQGVLGSEKPVSQSSKRSTKLIPLWVAIGVAGTLITLAIVFLYTRRTYKYRLLNSNITESNAVEDFNEMDDIT